MKPPTTKYAPANANSRSSSNSASAPVKTLRIGRVKAAVWENSGTERSFFNVTFTRTFVDEQKKFHDSTSFGRDDLLVLSKIADQAHSFICERMAAQTGEE